jgi:hypothetical protein
MAMALRKGAAVSSLNLTEVFAAVMASVMLVIAPALCAPGQSR